MMFCNNCGKQLEGSGRFCVHCGADTQTATSSGAGSVSVPPPAASIPYSPPMAAAAVQYAPPGAMPIPMGIPTPPPATGQKSGGMIGTLVVLAAIVGGGYYYYNHGKTTAPPANPPAAPASTPPGTTDNKALVQQQSFNAQWQDESGMLVLTSAKWTNNANVTLQSATVQCEQYNAVGTDLSQYRVTLNGPTQPNTASTYSNVQIGAIASGMTKVNCDVVHVKAAQ